MNPRITRLLAGAFIGWLMLFWLSYLIPRGVPPVIGARSVLPFPGWSAQAFTSGWLRDVSLWALDHSPFHYRALVLRNRALYLTARTLAPLPINPGTRWVSMGRNGFLFYLQDCTGYRTSRALDFMGDEVVHFGERIQETGRRFYFMPMPDKTSVYHDYIGPVQRWSDNKSKRKSLPEVFAAHLAKAPSLRNSYIPLWSAYQNARATSPELLYWKTCTHWNTAGLKVCLKEMLDHIQPGVFDPSFIKRRDVVENYHGDLIQHMLLLEDTETGPKYEIVIPPGHPRVPGQTLFMGDSFVELYWSLIKPWFEHAIFVHLNDGNHAFTKGIRRSDTVIFACVERYLAWRLADLQDPDFLDNLPPRVEP